MSVHNLFHDIAVDMAREHAAAISPEFREYRDLIRRYHEASATVSVASLEHEKLATNARKWKVREDRARKELAAIVQDFETRGWMLP
jgi:hypothetical protein